MYTNYNDLPELNGLNPKEKKDKYFKYTWPTSLRVMLSIFIAITALIVIQVLGFSDPKIGIAQKIVIGAISSVYSGLLVAIIFTFKLNTFDRMILRDK